MSRLPDYAETRIRETEYFSFCLPVTAFGYQDDMVVEISVEHFLSADKTHHLANVWAREVHSTSKHLVYTPSVPAAGGSASTEIFDALNSDDQFSTVMHDYIYEAAKHRE